MEKEMLIFYTQILKVAHKNNEKKRMIYVIINQYIKLLLLMVN